MNIAEQILSAGDDAAPAILTQGQVTTYAQLRDRVDRVARILLCLGHGKGERIGIFAENSIFFVAAYLGIVRAGLVAVPLQTDLSPETLARTALNAGMSLVLASQRLGNRAREWAAQASVPVLTEMELDGQEPTGAPEFPAIAAKTDLASLMFTSGSTGAPKGVMVTHRNIECNSRDIIQYLGLGPTDRAMVVLPFHYCFGLSLLHTHLMAGGSLVVNNAFKVFPEQTLDELGQQQCTGLAGVPSTFQILLRRTRFAQTTFPCLRWFQQAGGKLPNPCIQELQASFPQVKFFLMYGQTEATARLSYLPPARLADKLGSLGRGLPSTKLEVLKPDGAPVMPGSGEIGEIVGSGENIALGYWNDPVETARFFRDGKLHTGDLARVDEDGFIFFVERERDMLKPAGHRVSAREIEDVLAELPDVVEAAVVGAPHQLLGESIQAFIVLRPGAVLGSDQVRTHCRQRLALFKTPQGIHFVNSLPHNSAGKVRKRDLREMAAGRPMTFQAPAEEFEPAAASQTFKTI